MRLETIKIVCVLFIFFLLDFVRPLHFYLMTEFLFLGIVFVSLHYTLTYSLMFGVVFGIAKDSLFPSHFLFHTFCFIFFIFVISHVRAQFYEKSIFKRSVVAFSILSYALLNGVALDACDAGVIAIFCVQSYVLFYIIDYFLIQWIQKLSPEQ